MKRFYIAVTIKQGRKDDKMQNLIIDGKNLGEIIGYRQNREMKRWSFLMKSGYYIGVDFYNIRTFESGENCILNTYQEAKSNI